MGAAIEQNGRPGHVVTKLDLPALSDDLLGEYRGAVAEQREDLKLIVHAIDLEIERRLRAREAREMPHPKFDKIALEEQFSPYVPDFKDLNRAQQLLRELGKDEDAVKVVKHVPEQATIIAAHDVYGSPVSIAALIRKYGEKSEIGELLTRGLTRESLGTKLVVRVKRGL